MVYLPTIHKRFYSDSELVAYVSELEHTLANQRKLIEDSIKCLESALEFSKINNSCCIPCSECLFHDTVCEFQGKWKNADYIQCIIQRGKAMIESDMP